MEANMQRRQHPGDSSAHLVAAILAAAMLGIFAVVFIYNFSGDRTIFAGKNLPQATTGQSAGGERSSPSSTTGQSTEQ
jgi:hypothetical protein